MVIKKFIAKTEEAAVALAKEELGNDVVIMNVKKNTPHGFARLFRKETTEVTAALDEVLPEDCAQSTPDFSKLQESIQAEAKPASDSRAARTEAARQAMLQSREVLPDEDPEPEKKSGANAIAQKLSDLQNLLEKQIAAPAQEISGTEKTEGEDAQEDKTKSYYRLIRSQLEASEVDSTYIDQILGEMEESLGVDVSLDQILSGIYQKLVLKIGRPRLIDLHAEKKYIFFIGPTGVGKTTTIAKIASMLKLSRRAKVALVTSDTYRIAAVEQLKTYANILGVPLKVVYSPGEMQETIQELKEYDLVLIDTAGRSHHNREQREDIQRLLETIPETERDVFLVMSATTKYSDLTKISRIYSEITAYSLIFTKLDETDTVGSVFNIRMQTGAPLSYMTWGQNVPDDIGKVDAQKMAKQLLGGNSGWIRQNS